MIRIRRPKQMVLLLFVSFLLFVNPATTPFQFSVHQASGLSDILDCSKRGTVNYRREGIPSVDNPVFISVSEANSQIADDDLVVGVIIDGTPRVYPHSILRFHEIINDQTSATHIAATYCPLTGSAIVYPTAQLGGSTLGVTGILFESNLVFYDRCTDSCFVQLLSFGMTGPRVGLTLTYEGIIETSWATWKLMYPDSQVVSDDTGFDRDYLRNPYSGYETEASILHETSGSDEAPYNLYHPKEKTLVLITDRLRFLLPFAELAKEPVVNLNLERQKYVVFYDEIANYAIPYVATNQGEDLVFSKLIDNSQFTVEQSLSLPVYKDQFDTYWNVKGEAISGPKAGDVLVRFANFNTYWFAAAIFFPDGFIYTNGDFENYDVDPVDPEIFVPADELAAQDFVVIGLFLGMPVIILLIVKYRDRT